MDRYLFVIDYQNDFVDGALGFPGAEKLDEAIAARVRAYGPGHVLFTRDTHGEDYLRTREGKLLPVVHCVRGTHGWQVYGETARALEEVGAKAIDKQAFAMDISDPAVAAVLPPRADSVEMVGLVSNICVISNAVALQAKYPQARIRVDRDLTDSFDKELHSAALAVMEGFQVEITGGSNGGI